MSPATPSDPQNSRWHRLSALDSAFLAIEDERNLMHIGATALFEPGTWIDEAGRIDRSRFLRHSRVVLHQLPKWQQRVTRVPLVRHPVLVPDSAFDLSHHVRFVRLEHGTLQDVERLAADVYSRMLDREHPLWELVVVDGLEGRRFATIVKLHHCMADGVAGLAALMAMLSPTPNASIPDVPEEPAVEPPTSGELLRAELRWRAEEPRAIWRRARASVKGRAAVRERARAAASGLLSAVRTYSRPAPSTPLNPRHVGSRRAYRGVRLDLEEVKRVHHAAGATLNEVVLATVATALCRYFERQGSPLAASEIRCMVPVSLHRSDSLDLSGNEVSLMIVPLPIDPMQPRERLEFIVKHSQEAKLAGQSSAFALGERFADWTLAPLIPWAVQLVMTLRPYNIIVTNIPGPSIPFYLGDAKLVGVYPLVPLYANQALAVALVSYDGSLYWGLNADPDRVPNLDSLGDAIASGFSELRDAYLR